MTVMVVLVRETSLALQYLVVSLRTKPGVQRESILHPTSRTVKVQTDPRKCIADTLCLIPIAVVQLLVINNPPLARKLAKCEFSVDGCRKEVKQAHGEMCPFMQAHGSNPRWRAEKRGELGYGQPRIALAEHRVLQFRVPRDMPPNLANPLMGLGPAFELFCIKRSNLFSRLAHAEEVQTWFMWVQTAEGFYTSRHAPSQGRFPGVPGDCG